MLYSVDSVIVDDLDIRRTASGPDEANPELVVDPDGMLTLSITGKSFKTIARRRSQVGQPGRGIEITQLALRNREQISRKTLWLLTVEDRFGSSIQKARDHNQDVSSNDTSSKAKH